MPPFGDEGSVSPGRGGAGPVRAGGRDAGVPYGGFEVDLDRRIDFERKAA